MPTTKEYQPSLSLSTTTTTVVTPTSKKFLARARQKRAKNEPFDHWVRAARILWRIESDLPVGHHKRKRKSKSSAGGRADA